MAADSDLDPVYAHSRREAVVILIFWALTFAWTVPYCYFAGYGAPASAEELSLTLGVPSWVLWGVAVPWLACVVVSILLCVYYIRDDDLGQADDE